MDCSYLCARVSAGPSAAQPVLRNICTARLMNTYRLCLQSISLCTHYGFFSSKEGQLIPSERAAVYLNKSCYKSTQRSLAVRLSSFIGLIKLLTSEKVVSSQTMQSIRNVGNLIT